jgi:hypothetical protein
MQPTTEPAAAAAAVAAEPNTNEKTARRDQWPVVHALHLAVFQPERGRR